MRPALASFVELVSGRRPPDPVPIAPDVRLAALHLEANAGDLAELEDAGPPSSWPDTTEDWHWTPSAE